MRQRIDVEDLPPGQKLLVAIWVALFAYMALRRCLCAPWFIAASLLILVLSAGQTRAAEPSLNEILRDYENPALRATVVLKLSSIEAALGWANSALRAQRMSRQALYCQPDDLTIEPHELISMLGDALWDEPRFGDRPIGFVVLITLQRAFPCKERDD